jgi:hypothetical protein
MSVLQQGLWLLIIVSGTMGGWYLNPMNPSNNCRNKVTSYSN